MTLRVLALPFLFVTLSTFAACGWFNDDCAESNTCDVPAGVGGQGGAGAGNTGGATTTQGGGGSDPCENCAGFCKDGTQCVDCLNHSHCTDPGAAKCDPGTNECVACDPADADAATQCAGVPEGSICDAGTCVECTLGNESACNPDNDETCNLLTKECVGVGPGDVGNCRACTNDLQCATGLFCIPMDFEGSLHGHFCLKPDAQGCNKPYVVTIEQPSISGAPQNTYCGVNENLTTCQAARALENDWVCTGTDGKCCSGSSPVAAGMCALGEPEVDVPAALCRQVGTLIGDRCTIACTVSSTCLESPNPGFTCGDKGTMTTPDWCGG